MSGGEAEGSKDTAQPQESISRNGLVKPGPGTSAPVQSSGTR